MRQWVRSLFQLRIVKGKGISCLQYNPGMSQEMTVIKCHLGGLLPQDSKLEQGGAYGGRSTSENQTDHKEMKQMSFRGCPTRQMQNLEGVSAMSHLECRGPCMQCYEGSDQASKHGHDPCRSRKYSDSNGHGAASGKIVIIHLFSKCLLKNYGRDSKRDTDVKNRLLDSVGEGEGGMIWENSIETCILSYVK